MYLGVFQPHLSVIFSHRRNGMWALAVVSPGGKKLATVISYGWNSKSILVPFRTRCGTFSFFLSSSSLFFFLAPTLTPFRARDEGSQNEALGGSSYITSAPTPHLYSRGAKGHEMSLSAPLAMRGHGAFFMLLCFVCTFSVNTKKLSFFYNIAMYIEIKKDACDNLWLLTSWSHWVCFCRYRGPYGAKAPFLARTKCSCGEWMFRVSWCIRWMHSHIRIMEKRFYLVLPLCVFRVSKYWVGLWCQPLTMT